jgi:hypothetical protein
MGCPQREQKPELLVSVAPHFEQVMALPWTLSPAATT